MPTDSGGGKTQNPWLDAYFDPTGEPSLTGYVQQRNNYHIVLSSYRGHIYPGQGIVLYFSVDVLPNAKVQLPVLGSLALHFLRSSQRAILDSLNASQQNMFAKTLFHAYWKWNIT